MLDTYWLALGGFSLVMTVGWLFVERRITTTGLLAASGWSYMAISADSLTTITESGSEVSASAGSIGYFCTAMALLSFVAITLRYFGHYPPEDDDPATTGGNYA